MFALPGGNDIFPFLNVGQWVLMLIVDGIQATCYGVFLGCILPGRLTFLPPILIIGLALVCILLENMMGNYPFYDKSIFKNGFLMFLLRIVIPFSHMTMSSSFFFSQQMPK